MYFFSKHRQVCNFDTAKYLNIVVSSDTKHFALQNLIEKSIASKEHRFKKFDFMTISDDDYWYNENGIQLKLYRTEGLLKVQKITPKTKNAKSTQKSRKIV